MMGPPLQTIWDYSQRCLKFFLGLEPEPEAPSQKEWMVYGAVFVTLKKAGKLRGCIGSLEAYRPLWEEVRSNTHAAAFRDPRFPPLTREEGGPLDLEISLLGQSMPLVCPPAERPSLLAAAHPGVILESHGRRATFLPQVWEEIPEPVDFLERLCLKAGLPSHRWKMEDTKIWTYTVGSFKAPIPAFL